MTKPLPEKRAGNGFISFHFNRFAQESQVPVDEKWVRERDAKGAVAPLETPYLDVFEKKKPGGFPSG